MIFRKIKNYLKQIVLQLCPPIFLPIVKILYKRAKKITTKNDRIIISDPSFQDLDIYWDPNMAKILETWGEGNAWHEIQFIMINCQGRVLDIACGTGKTMEIIFSQFSKVYVYGCDISDFLISKAIERGIPSDHLIICDATQLAYPDNFFNYAYSIGSLEHFTEDGILKFLSECYRVTRKASFHQHPVSKSGNNEGWIKRGQSYHNNSTQWWLEKYNTFYKTVYVINSKWECDISVGKWFICIK